MLETQSKWYQFTFDITKTSESLDLGTPTHALPENHQIYHYRPTQVDVENSILSFLGISRQVPPKYSAISLDGKRAYQEVRKGNTVELPTREVEIFHIELLNYTFPHITLLVHISSGGYIRSLARDISEALGGTGVVTQLRRTRIDTLNLNTDELMYMEPRPGEHMGIQEIGYDIVFPDIQRIDLSDEEFATISYGHAIPRRNGIMSQKVFGYYKNEPMVLLREK